MGTTSGTRARGDETSRDAASGAGSLAARLCRAIACASTLAALVATWSRIGRPSSLFGGVGRAARTTAPSGRDRGSARGPRSVFVSYCVILPILRTISAMRSASLKITSAARVAGRLRLEPALEELGVAHDARERLVELVRGGARELGDDRLPLLREDLLLRLRRGAAPSAASRGGR